MPMFIQPSAAMPWACRTGPFPTVTSLSPAPGQTPLLPAIAGTWHTWACPGGRSESLYLPFELFYPSPEAFEKAHVNETTVVQWGQVLILDRGRPRVRCSL
jgi:hypothetical protein